MELLHSNNNLEKKRINDENHSLKYNIRRINHNKENYLLKFSLMSSSLRTDLTNKMRV